VFAIADAHFAADGFGRARVVAGDHLHANAGLLTDLDGQDGFGARRINDAHQAEEHHVGFQIVHAQVAFAGVHVARGGGEHAQALVAEFLDLLLPECAVERLVESPLRPRCWGQRSSRRSGAPLNRMRVPPPGTRLSVAMNLFSDSNGITATRS
jgi:hypothetical protein